MQAPSGRCPVGGVGQRAGAWSGRAPTAASCRLRMALAGGERPTGANGRLAGHRPARGRYTKMPSRAF
ncbi:hypothetical protein R1flu_022036 [Riccia fluitans]|uniref:Uncharacterized protein n=1 Tax=Riccia fluitans TaxID=41844 RepID=A0ABD1ZR16_9MARC